MTRWTLVAVAENRADEVLDIVDADPGIVVLRDDGLSGLNRALVDALGGSTDLADVPEGWERDGALAQAVVAASDVVTRLAAGHGHVVIPVTPPELLPFWLRVQPDAHPVVEIDPPGPDVRVWARALLSRATRRPFPAFFDITRPESVRAAIDRTTAGESDPATALHTTLTSMPSEVTGPLAALLLEGVAPPGHVDPGALVSLRTIEDAILVVTDRPLDGDPPRERAVRELANLAPAIVTWETAGQRGAVPDHGTVLDPHDFTGLEPASVARALEPTVLVLLGDLPPSSIAGLVTNAPRATVLACPETRLPVGHRPVDAVTDLARVARAVADRVGRWSGPEDPPGPVGVPEATRDAPAWARVVSSSSVGLGSAVAASRAHHLAMRVDGATADDDAVERAVEILRGDAHCVAVVLTEGSDGSWLVDTDAEGMVVVRRRDLRALGGLRDIDGPDRPQVEDLLVRARRLGRTVRATGALVRPPDTDPWRAAAVQRRLRTPPSPGAFLATGFVLSDNDPLAARATAHSLLQLVDEVSILERGRVLDTEVVGSGPRVGVKEVDWEAGAGSELANTHSRWVVVAGAGETLSVSAVPDARCELERAVLRPHAMRVGDDRFEARLIPADPSFENAIGAESPWRLAHSALDQIDVTAL